MRVLPIAFVLLITAPSFGQPVGFGLKLGSQLTDRFTTDTVTRTDGSLQETETYNADERRFVIGPMAELRLPLGVAIEANALYRSIEYSVTQRIQDAEPSLIPFDETLVFEQQAKSFDFPILLKYRFSGGLLRPYIGAGYVYRRVFDVESEILDAPGAPVPELPPGLNQKGTSGVLVEGGLELKFLFLRVAPELRYTRWGSKSFRAALGGIVSNSNEVEFLVGFGF